MKMWKFYFYCFFGVVFFVKGINFLIIFNKFLFFYLTNFNLFTYDFELKQIKKEENKCIQQIFNYKILKWYLNLAIVLCWIHNTATLKATDSFFLWFKLVLCFVRISLEFYEIYVIHIVSCTCYWLVEKNQFCHVYIFLHPSEHALYILMQFQSKSTIWF